MTAFCHSCRAALVPDARFCKRCGAPHASDPSVPAGAPYSPDTPIAPQQGVAGFVPHGAAQTHPPPGYPPPDYPPAMSPPPGYVPQAPAPTSQGSRSWLAIAGAATAFVVVAGAIVAAVLTSANGGGGVHAATVLTVTTPRAASSAGSGADGSEVHHTSAPRAATGHAVAVQTGPLSLVPYRGTRISAELPVGWNTVENEEHKTGYIESKWSNPADSNDTILIDTSPATTDTLEQDAAPVHNDLLQASGYHELFYGPGNLAGVASWMWVFRISGDQRVDYFFNRCASGYAVLGSTVPSRFDRLLATFRAVTQSVEPTNRSIPC